MRWLSDDAVAHLRAVTEAPDLAGTPYELVRELGRGGMGVVYEVRDRELGRGVALKVIDDDGAAEARIIAGLEHPGIVPVHDTGLLPDGRRFYTMKLVRGRRLDAWAAEPHGRTERLRLFVRVCEPLAFAHAVGIVHRDLKPENVMVGEFGAVLVMDWGVARTAGEEEHVIAGTPGYMAPEQARGEAADPRSDVYALGAILSFLLGSDPIPTPLAAIVGRATAPSKEERYATARELAEDVLRFLDHEPVLAHRENPLERAARFLSRHRALAGLIVAYLLMRVIVFFWMRV